MAAVSTVPKLLRVAAIVGSLRKASINAGVARAFAAVAPEYGMEVVVIENDLPMFNSDLWTLNDRGDPSGPGAVDAAKAAVAAADAVAIISPEYNYGVSSRAEFARCVATNWMAVAHVDTKRCRPVAQRPQAKPHFVCAKCSRT